ncbi:MAG: sugar phosphate isomerase/epimerase family protein [Candidatus Baldrarchaeia archaeon]
MYIHRFKLSRCTNPSEKNLRLLNELGFDGIELAAYKDLNPDVLSKAEVKKLKELIDSYELKVPCINSLFMLPGFQHCSAIYAVRMNSLRFTKKLCETATIMECPILCWGSGMARRIPPDIPYEIGRRWNMKLLKKSAKFAEEYGVILAIEPLPRDYDNFINTLEDAMRIMEEIGSEAIKLLADIHHMHLEEPIPVPDALKKYGKYIVHVHYWDNNLRIPGDGQIDWFSVTQALADIKYQGYISIEAIVGDEKRDLTKAKSYLDQIFSGIKWS